MQWSSGPVRAGEVVAGYSVNECVRISAHRCIFLRNEKAIL
jgi:hypothetical protein